MKIQSHDITYTTVHEFSYERVDTFKQELQIKPFDEISAKSELTSINEIDLLARLKFALIQEFLKFLNQKDTQNYHCTPSYDTTSFNSQEKTYQLRTIKTVQREYESTYKEAESLSVFTQGVVKTQDGSSIQLDLNFTMKRSFYSKTSIKESTLIDPLIINFDADMSSIDTDKTFCFDIDCDGKSDQISRLNQNSGFLALDKNENKIIDDGSELFGVKEANAFEELSAYDKDENSWIDENDAIFDSLRIWNNDTLFALGEVGIGAIYLGAQNSPYTYKNSENETVAKLRQSSIFLYESGEVGTIGQIDFAKQEVKEPLSEILAKT